MFQRRNGLRISINLGGVNIAARLEALAEPGGVCISEKVHNEVRGKIDVEMKDLGPSATQEHWCTRKGLHGGKTCGETCFPQH